MKAILNPAIYLFFVITLFPGSLFSDSPITSTPFYKAYLDLEIVKKANSKGILDDEIATFLLNPKNPIDHKAAVINALGWDINKKTNAEIFQTYLIDKYDTIIEISTYDKISGDDLFCLGYLTVMDNYFELDKPYNMFRVGYVLVQREHDKHDFKINKKKNEFFKA